MTTALRPVPSSEETASAPAPVSTPAPLPAARLPEETAKVLGAVLRERLEGGLPGAGGEDGGAR